MMTIADEGGRGDQPNAGPRVKTALRLPPWGKINFPPFFREKGRTIIFCLVSALLWVKIDSFFATFVLPHTASAPLWATIERSHLLDFIQKWGPMARWEGHGLILPHWPCHCHQVPSSVSFTFSILILRQPFVSSLINVLATNHLSYGGHHLRIYET